MLLKGFGKKLRNLISSGRRDELFFEELEDLLVEGDLGAATAMEAGEKLRESARINKSLDQDAILKTLKNLLKDYMKIEKISLQKDTLNLILVLGVNGVGKTTTIAKLAHKFSSEIGKENIILCAGDTFRAAAIDQIKIHGERLGIKVVSQDQGADAGAVLYDSIESALHKNIRLVIADTAGRMHNKANLIRELQKLDKIIRRKINDSAHHNLLVIDATTGQNGYQQAEIFNEAIGVNSIALTKYDSAAKGGIAVSISKNLGLAFSLIGMGEGMDDLKQFDLDLYLNTLLGVE